MNPESGLRRLNRRNKSFGDILREQIQNVQEVDRPRKHFFEYLKEHYKLSEAEFIEMLEKEHPEVLI